MNREKKRIFKVALVSVILLITLWIMKDFSLSWVEVNDNEAKITVNFLFPMDKDKLPACIHLSNQLPYANQFDYTMDWLSDSVVCIKLKEKNLVKGQKVRLIIKNAPSKFSFLTRNASTTVQFTAPVKLLEPTGHLLISTTKPFMVKFNTPMDKNKLNKFLACDAAFYIEPINVLNQAGKKVEDTSTFQFIPKRPLENNHKYILSFRKGMCAQSGALLKKDTSVILTTDTKPIISTTYPANNNKWIGLYPKFMLETQSPCTVAYLSLNSEIVKAKKVDDYHFEFLMNKVLASDTTYEAVFQAESKSGERSLSKMIHFTTVRIDPDRIWIEIQASDAPKVKVYKGFHILKTMPCSIGDKTAPIPLGTYYIQNKGESFVDAKNKEGANFWLKITDKCVFHGLIRDAYWNVKSSSVNPFGKPIKRSNIMLKDEDARWLFDTTSPGTMVIIYK